MKKIGIVLGFIVLISLVSGIVSSQTDVPMDSSIQQNVDKVQQFTESAKWDYLSQEWKNITLKNKFVSQIDSTLRKGNFVFLFLFGQNYDLSLTLLFVIIFWIFFYVNFYFILSSFSMFSKSVSSLLSLGLVIIFAHLGFLKSLSDLVFKVIFYKEGVWGWISFIIFISLIFIIPGINRYITKSIQKNKDSAERKLENEERVEFKKAFEKTAEAFRKSPA